MGPRMLYADKDIIPSVRAIYRRLNRAANYCVKYGSVEVDIRIILKRKRDTTESFFAGSE